MPVSTYTPNNPSPAFTEARQLASDAIVRLVRELASPVNSNTEQVALSVFNLYHYGELLIIDQGNAHA